MSSPGPTGPSGLPAEASAKAGPSGPDEGERLPLTFVTILVAEVLSIVGLYWLGAHFS